MTGKGLGPGGSIPPLFSEPNTSLNLRIVIIKTDKAMKMRVGKMREMLLNAIACNMLNL